VPGGESEALTPLVRTLRIHGVGGPGGLLPRTFALPWPLSELACRFDLHGRGTDFHGDLLPEIKMAGRGELRVPFATYEALTAKTKVMRSVKMSRAC
jgi:hypothetical protein